MVENNGPKILQMLGITTKKQLEQLGIFGNWTQQSRGKNR
jgi:hypothetical protein